jgi:hypothetical protein
MSRADDKRIANLARKNAAKIKPAKEDQKSQFDPTLRQRPADQSPETQRLFKEMKRREF